MWSISALVMRVQWSGILNTLMRPCFALQYARIPSKHAVP